MWYSAFIILTFLAWIISGIVFFRSWKQFNTIKVGEVIHDDVSKKIIKFLNGGIISFGIGVAFSVVAILIKG
ncbi:hypothetical protein QA612_14055 [Evansella sp. AB-P1]|uniref:hypothetical protein n=1 Tax=Evansella sp. AB-P1 TaxID=3037653 RepID=UPI00241CA407|nr:hypothetical protein [Evansella sp. AB-P1]MDG5788605.1 hypothetical protein [Evansella sp. AB-P1]